MCVVHHRAHGSGRRVLAAAVNSDSCRAGLAVAAAACAADGSATAADAKWLSNTAAFPRTCLPLTLLSRLLGCMLLLLGLLRRLLFVPLLLLLLLVPLLLR